MRRLVLGLLAAVLLLVSTPALASARSTTHSDPTHDTWVMYGDSGVSVPAPPTFTLGDITRVFLEHRKRVVRIIMTATDANTTAVFDIVNGRGQVLSIYQDPDNTLLVRTVRNGTYHSTTCHGIRHSVNLDAGKWAVTVPRKCLHSPRKVRLQASTAVDDAYTVYDPSDGRHHPGTSPWVKRS